MKTDWGNRPTPVKKSGGKIVLMIIAAAVILSAGCYFIGSGFFRLTDVFIEDYSVSADGTVMTVKIAAAGSVGHVRKITVRKGEDGVLYMDCRSAFGGINGSLGAKDVFTVPLDEKTEAIAILRDADRYENVLRKDESGSWQRAG